MSQSIHLEVVGDSVVMLIAGFTIMLDRVDALSLGTGLVQLCMFGADALDGDDRPT